MCKSILKLNVHDFFLELLLSINEILNVILNVNVMVSLSLCIGMLYLLHALQQVFRLYLMKHRQLLFAVCLFRILARKLILTASSVQY